MGLEWLLLFVVALYMGFRLGSWKASSRQVSHQSASDATASQASEPSTVDLLAIAKSLEAPIQETAHPSALLDMADFEGGVSLLCDKTRPTFEVLNDLKGENWVISCIAGEALCRRKVDEDVSASLLAHIRYLGPWPLYFVLKYLSARNDGPLVGPVLVQAQQWWSESRPMASLMEEFISERCAQGERPTFSDWLDRCTDEEVSHIAAFLDVLGMEVLEPLRGEVARWQTSHVNVGELRAIGNVWERVTGTSIVEHAALARHANRLESVLHERPYSSILLVGDTGVGKTSLVKVLARRLQQQGWTVFEAAATDLLAGQVYIGELEGRIKSLIDAVGTSRRVLWYAPNFHEFLYAGSHRHDPSGLLDRILPAIESRMIVILGETTPRGYSRLMQTRKRLRSAMETIHVPPLSDSDTLLVTREWVKQQETGEKASILDQSTITEAFNLVKQYLTERGTPGSLLEVIQATFSRVTAKDQVSRPISISDFLATLSQMTGLPQKILDDRQDLSVEALRGLFQQRVIGQTEAVNSIVDRVAMLKAGLNDPSRPLGVFLFVGPTGTGKTEIAKTLSTFLFGSEDRMIRLDMSEFQSTDAMGRILGQPGAETANSLVDLLRRQPFSVVLLDEFEKAHSRIWDLFLQVFDDGRLTDRSGNLADFRHSIIILTSNLGGRISSGTSIGFTLGGVSFSRNAVEREVKDTFRPEFINRIDRVVVFHPLSRDVMRRILRRQLDDVLRRRGFRKRDWAVEWDESAVEFLLQKGFTSDLGARPLRRAVEHYLLSPLSITIVQHEFPEGDQFLFITSDGNEIKAEFVDPDVPVEESLLRRQGEAGSLEVPPNIQLKTIALDARGSSDEMAFLREELGRLRGLTSRDEWETLKRESLGQIGLPGFWDIPDRFAILSKIEVMDRIESGLRGASSLMQRLSGSSERTHYGYLPDLLRRLAEQLYLLDTAHSDFLGNRPHDAFVLMDAQLNPQISRELVIDFFRKLNHMYVGWAEKRRMRYRQLLMEENVADHCRSVIAVSGFGAFSILEREAGLHLLETPKEKRAFERCKVRVRVVPQSKEFSQDDKGLLRQAETMVLRAEEGTPRVVRRYRVEPSPLVRDSVRHWRTGHLARVLSGDFDLIH